jgi:hypothetical protein
MACLLLAFALKIFNFKNFFIILREREEDTAVDEEQ